MKIIGRILILLFAAAVVIGVTYAFSQTAAARSVFGERGGFEGRGGDFTGGEFRGDPNQTPGNVGGRGNGQGNFAGGFERGSRGGGDFDRGFGGLSLVVVLRNLAIIAGVILVVQVLRLGWRKLKPVQA